MNIARPIAADEQLTSLKSASRPLQYLEELLMRARINFAELKRTGAREGLSELLSDVTKLKSEIEQLEKPL
jgi:hypothetical protein